MSKSGAIPIDIDVFMLLYYDLITDIVICVEKGLQWKWKVHGLKVGNSRQLISGKG